MTMNLKKVGKPTISLEKCKSRWNSYFIWWTRGDGLIDKDREVSNMIDKAIGQYYDLETIVGNNNLNYISFSPHDLK